MNWPGITPTQGIPQSFDVIQKTNTESPTWKTELSERKRESDHADSTGFMESAFSPGLKIKGRRRMSPAFGNRSWFRGRSLLFPSCTAEERQVMDAPVQFRFLPDRLHVHIWPPRQDPPGLRDRRARDLRRFPG